MKKTILLILFTISINAVFADSPLTSTNFYQAYLDVPMVKEATVSKGRITTKMMDYIHNENNPLEIKLAIINAIGFNFKGLKNSRKFLKYVLKKKKYKLKYLSKKTAFKSKATADELICYAYMKALDNYFNVQEASLFSAQALKRNPKSYTIAIINQLIVVQMLLNRQKEWCEVYRSMNNIRANKDLIVDFRKEASTVIFNYTDIYKEYCTIWHSIKKIF
jgi:hypothetical protein